jgi:hypothetical protein
MGKEIPRQQSAHYRWQVTLMDVTAFSMGEHVADVGGSSLRK